MAPTVGPSSYSGGGGGDSGCTAPLRNRSTLLPRLAASSQSDSAAVSEAGLSGELRVVETSGRTGDPGLAGIGQEGDPKLSDTAAGGQDGDPAVAERQDGGPGLLATGQDGDPVFSSTGTSARGGDSGPSGRLSVTGATGVCDRLPAGLSSSRSGESTSDPGLADINSGPVLRSSTAAGTVHRAEANGDTFDLWTVTVPCSVLDADGQDRDEMELTWAAGVDAPPDPTRLGPGEGIAQ